MGDEMTKIHTEPYMPEDTPASDGVCFDTLDAAKAAAQADYAARILSQFEPGDGWQGE